MTAATDTAPAPSGNHFLLFDKRQNRGRNLVLFHGHDLIDIRLANFKRIFARLLDSNTVGNGGNLFKTLDLAVTKRIEHARCAASLNAVHLNARLQLFGRKRYAGNESAAADRARQ